jgi:hypothetical protein
MTARREPMPLYRATTFKEWVGVPYNEQQWRNVYLLESPVKEDALSDCIAIGQSEMATSYTPVHFTRAHVVNIADKNDAATSARTEVGALITTGLGGPVPLFNTIRVVIADAAGRPEQKYYRLGANVANIENGVWSGEFVASVQTSIADWLLTLASYVSPHLEPMVSATALQPIQIRQLGWHRRTRPGFKRGWVPVGP